MRQQQDKPAERILPETELLIIFCTARRWSVMNAMKGAARSRLRLRAAREVEVRR
jgi:hypothetical protein